MISCGLDESSPYSKLARYDLLSYLFGIKSNLKLKYYFSSAKETSKYSFRMIFRVIFSHLPKLHSFFTYQLI